MAELPPGWTTAALGEHVKWTSGGTPKRSIAEHFGPGLPWLSIADLNDAAVRTAGESLTDSGLANSTAKRLPPKTLVIAMYGSIGKLGVTAMPACTSQAIAAATELEHLTVRYLFHFLLYSRTRLQRSGRGNTQSNIGLGDLRRLTIPVPPVEEQRRIAGILDHVNELRAKRRNSIVILETLAESAFHDVTGAPSNPVNNSRSTPVMDLVRDTSRLGARIPRRSYEDTGKHPIVDQGKQRIAGYTSDANTLYRGTLPVILFGDHTRAVKFIDEDFAIGADGLKVLTPMPGNDPTYIFHAIHNLHIPSAGYSRHFKFLKERLITVPSIEAQREFAGRARAIEGQRELYRRELGELDRLFASLQARAFRGEL